MPKIDSDTKEKIRLAAEKVFHNNGYKGTRTTQIAEEAGISRTMLHYYYSTKEALFQEVLNNTLGSVFNHLKKGIREEQDLDNLIAHLIDIIADLLEEKPGLPSFIVNIMNESPELAMFLAASQEDNVPLQLDALLEEGKKKKQVAADITGEDLIMNIYMLCAGPYLGKYYIKAKENRDEAAMKTFIRERKENIKRFVLKGIQSDEAV